MRILKCLVHRRDTGVPALPPPEIRGYDRNDVAHLRSYDRELQKLFQQRMRSLDLDADVLGRHSPGER